MRSVLDYRREPGHKRSTLASPRSKKTTKDSKSGGSASSAPRAPRAAKSRASKSAPRGRAAKGGVPAVVVAPEPVALSPVPDFLEFLPQKPASMVRSGPRHAVFIDVENTSS